MCVLTYLKCFMADLSNSTTKQTKPGDTFLIVFFFFLQNRRHDHMPKSTFPKTTSSCGGFNHIIRGRLSLAKGSLSNVENTKQMNLSSS